MNIHHLELFYYVARHGGIMEAVRNIPYGIQQPAVSGQVAQLEQFLGVTLFRRRPFALTSEGEKLYKFIEPFFSNIDRVASELQGGEARQLRIGASPIVLRDHIPGAIRALKRKFPRVKVSLREGYPAQLESMLERGEIDLAVTVAEKKPAPGIQSFVLLELPLVLLVHKSSSIESAESLWEMDRIEEPLISMPPAEVLSKNFQQKLAALKVDWYPSVEASSLELIERYVANGLGIGVSVNIPGRKCSPEVRVLALPDFPPLIIAAMWRGKPSPLLQMMLDEARRRAEELKN